MIHFRGWKLLIPLAVGLSLFLFFYSIDEAEHHQAPDVQFVNRTEEAGLSKYTQSFAIVVSDIDNDSIDDLFVGHHDKPPSLYLNNNMHFVDRSDVTPLNKRKDRHGFTFVDLDNDGDKDFLVTGGGADGIGAGDANEVYKNLLMETRELKFIDVSADSDVAYPILGSRQFLPIPNLQGDKVDFFLTALHRNRPNVTNFYAVNRSTPDKIRLLVDKGSSLNQRWDSDGKDLFADFDRDGQMDLLRVGSFGRVQQLMNKLGQFSPFPSVLDDVRTSITAVATDLNNDGFPDLYVGCGNGINGSDYVSNNANEIHFSVARQDNDPSEEISFKSAPGDMAIDFVQHIPKMGAPRKDPSDIYIGAGKSNPASRKAQIGPNQALEKPENTEKPGTYIWYDQQADLWHVLWRHDADDESGSKGIIYAKNVTKLQKNGFETFSAKKTQDYIFINQQGRGWQALPLNELEHDEWTNHVTAADFNNDGFIDIVGLRTRDDANGTPFILINNGNLTFTRHDILENREDDIFRADLIVHGFFNDDGLPDLFYTNGYGLLPDHQGPYQLWINASQNQNGYLLMELEGTRANRDAIGAQVELYDEQDKLLGYRELGAAYGRGQNTHKIHFGLGEQQGPFRVRIRWPGESSWQPVPVARNNSHHVLQE